MDNITEYFHLYSSIGEFLIMMAICSLRILLVFTIIPALGDQIIQNVHRMSIAVLLASFVVYGQSLRGLAGYTPFSLIAITAKEAILGLILGFCASTVFWIAAGVGMLVDNSSGFNNVQVSNPLRNDTSTPTSALLSQLSITAFWALGGMMFLLSALYQSFQWWPVLSVHPEGLPILESFVLSYTDSLMQAIVKLATPMLLILVMIDFSFGFLAKGAEKIDTMSLSMPVKGAVTLLLLAIFISIFIQQLRPQLSLQGLSEKVHLLQPTDASAKTK